MSDERRLEDDWLRESELLAPGLIHELRHPLMGIKAGLELLARDLGPTLTSLDDYALVSAQVARLEELLKSYQQLFSPTSSQVMPFALEPVLRRAVDLLAFRLRRLGPRFEWRPQGEHLTRSSPNAILHATINLLANALDAVDPAKGRVALRVVDGPVEIRISDDGAGIRPADVPRLFEPNFTTKRDGTGLGLHIARRAMSRAGGTVLLVAADDPRRLPWAVTEFAVRLEVDR